MGTATDEVKIAADYVTASSNLFSAPCFCLRQQALT
ncbi:MAG: HAD family hydrolase [Bacteroidales bacterium]|nr:HAD family hydrolase [Bacteroidales bacterium]